MRDSPSTAGPHRISDADSAAAAARLPRGSRVTLTLPAVDPDVATRLQGRLNALLNECGCRMSAALLMAGVVTALVVDVVAWRRVLEAPVRFVALELALVFVASAAGRFGGIVAARWRLRVTLRALAQLLATQP